MGSTIHHTSPAVSTGDSQATLDTTDARLLNAVLSAPGPSKLFERLIEGASWFALGKALLVTGGALSGLRIASPSAPLNPALYAALFVAFGGVGAWLVIGGTRDRGAQSLGGFFLLAGLACARGAYRTLGYRAGGIVGAVVFTDLDPLMPLCLWGFAREFPSRIASLRERTVVDAIGAVSAGAGAVLLSIGYASASGFDMPATFQVGGSNWFWGITFGLTALALAYLLSRCLRGGDGHRVRASWMLLALVIGLAPLVLEVIAEALIPAFGAWGLTTTFRPMLGTALLACVLTLPFTTAYAVVSRQTLDVRIIMRRALRCALTKYGCAALCVLPLVYIARLAYFHRAMPIRDVAALTSAHIGVAAALLGILGLFLYPRLLGAIDDLFFGPRYNARNVTADFRAAMWRTANANASAALLARTAISVLSAGRASVLLRLIADGAYRDGSLDCVLPADSKLIDALARDRRPDIPVTDRLLASIGDADAQWITRTTSVLLVPVRAETNEVLAILGVGPRSDERPYYAEDRHLLTDLAIYASPILERQLASSSRLAQPPMVRSSVPAAECPACGIVVPSEQAGGCPHCATPMERSSLPYVVNDKYRVQSRIGRGGMGVVYRAYDVILRRSVALKTLPYLSAIAEHRSASEGRAMAGAAHPNIVTVFGFEMSLDRPVLVLELLEGGTLKDRLTTGPLPIEDTLAVVMSLCDGLSWLHRRGISHGDIKPSNVGFCSSGVPKLLDLGLAESVEPELPAVQSQRIGGTLQYRCPYQPGRSYASNDLWGLAAVMFECLSGLRIFDVLSSLPPHHDAPDVRRFRPEVSPELATVLSRALSPHAAVRPQSADEFRLWLEGAAPV